MAGALLALAYFRGSSSFTGSLVDSTGELRRRHKQRPETEEDPAAPPQITLKGPIDLFFGAVQEQACPRHPIDEKPGANEDDERRHC